MLYLMVDDSQVFPATVKLEFEVTADNMIDMLKGNLTATSSAKIPHETPRTPPASLTSPAFYPGAICTMMLHDMGAEIIKIEDPQQRRLRPLDAAAD